MYDTPPAIARPSRTWEVLCHAAALCGFIGIPLGNVFGPLIVWLMKRSESPEVEEHGKEALNFQISVSIYLFGLGALALGTFLFTILPVVGLIGLPLIFLMAGAAVVVAIANVVFIIIASVKASDGTPYRYPFNLRLIK